MIDREQLAAALAGLDPRDREILDYSLRRRVPDEDLAELFGGVPGDIARLRAAAVERLSTELDVQRGADLGHLLRELLEPATWARVVSPGEHEEQAPVPDHGPVGVTSLPAQPPEPTSPAPGATPAWIAEEEEADPAAAPSPEAELPESQESPVLGMLVRDSPQQGERSRRPGRWLTLALALAVALLVPAGMVAALSLSDDDDEASGNRPAPGTRTFEPESGILSQPFPADNATSYRYPVAYVDKVSNLYEAPRSNNVKVRIARRTDWDTPRALGVVRRDGAWLAVQVPELRNGEVGWIHEDQVARLTSVQWAVHVDLSKRELVVKRDGTPIRRLDVGVGRKGHATPTGRFAVTDKLRVKDPDSPYGCCVLALTGHQTRLPTGWPGGDRLAVHATRDLRGIGRAVSLGCVRTDPRDTRWMMRVIPLGSPVFIEA